MRHEGGGERRNVSRSAVESGKAARDEAPSAVAGGSLSPRWKCGRLHGRECSAETGADERPLIAVSAGNFITVNKYPSLNRHLLFRIKNRLCYKKWLMLFSLKFHRDNRQNALALYSAKRKTGKKGCIFTALWR